MSIRRPLIVCIEMDITSGTADRFISAILFLFASILSLFASIIASNLPGCSTT